MSLVKPIMVNFIFELLPDQRRGQAGSIQKYLIFLGSGSPIRPLGRLKYVTIFRATLLADYFIISGEVTATQTYVGR
jgi:hypothetical protein